MCVHVLAYEYQVRQYSPENAEACVYYLNQEESLEEDEHGASEKEVDACLENQVLEILLVFDEAH